MNMRQCDSKSLQNWRDSQYSILILIQYLYTLFTNGRQPGTNTRPNMESRRFGIKICFRANFGQLNENIGHLKAVSLMRQFPDCYFHWG